MKYYLHIPYPDGVLGYSLLPSGDRQVISLTDIIHLEIVKYNDHRYVFSAFCYKRRYLAWPREFRTKKELYGAIQKLLQEYL